MVNHLIFGEVWRNWTQNQFFPISIFDGSGFFSALLNLTVLISLFVSLCLALVSPFIIHLLVPGFGSEEKLLCLQMFVLYAIFFSVTSTYLDFFFGRIYPHWPNRFQSIAKESVVSAGFYSPG